LWKWPDYQKQSTCSMQPLSKFKWYSAQNRKNNHEIHLETQRPQIAKAVLSKKFNAGGLTISNFKIYYRAITIKTAWYWHKNREEDQWIRKEDADIKPRIYSQLIFDKEAQNTQWRKDSLFTKCCWENWTSTCRRWKLDPYFSLYTKINSKSIKDLNIRFETLKLLQKLVGSTQEHIAIGNKFLNRTLLAQQLRERMNKWNCIKLKTRYSIQNGRKSLPGIHLIRD
jgi:hypothetical protein